MDRTDEAVSAPGVEHFRNPGDCNGNSANHKVQFDDDVNRSAIS